MQNFKKSKGDWKKKLAKSFFKLNFYSSTRMVLDLSVRHSIMKFLSSCKTFSKMLDTNTFSKNSIRVHPLWKTNKKGQDFLWHILLKIPKLFCLMHRQELGQKVFKIIWRILEFHEKNSVYFFILNLSLTDSIFLKNFFRNSISLILIGYGVIRRVVKKNWCIPGVQHSP